MFGNFVITLSYENNQFFCEHGKNKVENGIQIGIPLVPGIFIRAGYSLFLFFILLLLLLLIFLLTLHVVNTRKFC